MCDADVMVSYIEQNVLRFDVTVKIAVAMNVFDGLEQLKHAVGHFVSGQICLLLFCHPIVFENIVVFLRIKFKGLSIKHFKRLGNSFTLEKFVEIHFHQL